MSLPASEIEVHVLQATKSIQEWAKMYDISEAKMAWYVPSEKGKELVEALLKKFLFPVVESLKNKNMDR